MPASRTLVYPKTTINTVNRYNVRERYDLETIHTIINTSTVVHVSLPPPSNANPFPICLPMVGVAASYEHPSASLGEPLDVYLHGYVSSRMMNMSRSVSNDRTNGNIPLGLPVTISATKVDGLVLTLTPNTHDINYRSATLFGYGTIVEDQDEKVWAMEQVTNSVVRDRWRHTRVPPDGAEMQSTSILRVKIVGGSGKIRVGGPRDEQKDLIRDDVKKQTWTGVVPVWEHFGEPVTIGGGDVKEVPDHVTAFAKEEASRNEKYAKACILDRSQD